MSFTAAELCAEVYGLSGFADAGIGFAGSTDPDDKMIFFLLRQAARDLGKYKWSELVRTGTIEISGLELQYALPNDFREFIPGSVRVKDDVRWVDFPTSFSEWARVDSNIGPVGIEHRLQMRQGLVTKLPQDSAAYTLRFEYISNHPCVDLDGNGKPYFTADTDVWLLDDDLMVKALKAKWSIEKGLDTLTTDASAFDSYLNMIRGTQMHSQRVRFVSPPNYYPAPPYTNTWKG